MGFFIDKLKQNVNAKIFITGFASGSYIVGYITEDVSFSMGAMWNSAQAHNKTSALSDVYNKATRAANFWGADFNQAQIRHMASTVVSWEGSNPFTFSIPIMFVAIDPSDDVREPQRTLAEATYPEYDSMIAIPPNKFKMTGKEDGKIENGLKINVGKWFETKPIFVVDNASFSYSKQTTKTGNPLFCNADISFMAGRDLSFTEVQGFFKVGSVGSMSSIGG